MVFIKDLLLKFLDGTNSSSNAKNKLASEEEILRAIDELINKEKEVHLEELEYVKYTKVTSPGCWSLFKYLGVPNISGLERIKEDQRIHFTIPCGWDTDETLKFWFLCVPYNGHHSEVSEFFTSYDITKAQSDV